jgi:uncharacterized membrane protein
MNQHLLAAVASVFVVSASLGAKAQTSSAPATLSTAADVAPSNDDGCGCSVAGSSDCTAGWLLGGTLLALCALRRKG